MLRVMIVEDEHFMRIGIKNSIRWPDIDMQVVADAENGARALSQYRRLRPDIMIVDLKMPVMSGLELMREIRAQDKRTRFIILTCLDEFALVKEALSLGATGYILKLTSDQGEIESNLAKARDELERLDQSPPRARSQYVDQRSIDWQLLRDFLVYEKIPADSFRQLLEDARRPLSPERMRVIMVRFAGYEAMRGKLKDPLGYQLKYAVADLLGETMASIAPARVYGEEDGDFLILASLAGVEDKLEDALLDKLVIGVKESVLRLFNENVQIGISSAASSVDALPALRREALSALRRKQPLPYKVEAALEYLAAHYMEDISIKSAADYVGISPNYMGHLFLRHLGMTFTEQLNKVRVDHAQSLLRNPQYMIYEVGAKVGIDNTTYFTRLYKRYTGKTPRDFRREIGI